MKATLILPLLALIAVGCSGKDPLNREANPLKDYSALDGAVTPHNERARTQYYVSDIFDIHADDEQNSRRILNFVEGEAAVQAIRARLYMDGIRFDLKAHNLPKGATLTPDGGEAGVWNFTWKPELGFIPPSQRERQWDLQIELVPQAGQDNRAIGNLPSQIERTVTFSLMVRHTELEPTIVAVKGLSAELSEAQSVPFKIEVADPAGHNDAAPAISWSYDPAQYSNETRLYSGQNGIDWDYENLKPRRLSNGNWEFSLIYYPQVVAAMHRNNINDSKLGVQFYIQALSQASERLSPTYSQTLNIRLNQPTARTADTTDAGGTQ